MEQQATYEVDVFNPNESLITIRPFDPNHNGWQVNVDARFFDYIIRELKQAEFIVLVYMIRKIQTWGKSEDRISHSLIVQETMISSKQTVNTAIRKLTEKELITRNRKAPREIMTYSLNPDFEVQIREK